jgi:glutamate carboxypeptidase
MQDHRAEIISRIEAYVRLESPSDQFAAINRLANAVAADFGAAGCQVKQLENPNGANHLLVVAAPQANCKAKVLLIGHIDTVWPLQTIDHLPFRIEGDRAYGPGIFDMKAGIVIALFALRALRECQIKTHQEIRILLTTDEEIGSPDGRRHVEALASDCEAALVLEPALPNGALKSSRKGVGRFEIAVQGRAAHAGVEPEKGANAIVEAAHQVLAVEQLANKTLGTTITACQIEAGSAPNVVPAHAKVIIDARAWTAAEADRVKAAFFSLRPINPEIQLHVSGGWNRPPMEQSPESTALLRRVQSVGSRIGFALEAGATGGGSDGNFTAALGVPTLDGLGAEGDGAHANHEHIIIASIIKKAVLLTLFLADG